VTIDGREETRDVIVLPGHPIPDGLDFTLAVGGQTVYAGGEFCSVRGTLQSGLAGFGSPPPQGELPLPFRPGVASGGSACPPT
jgi:hypothetical protein